MATLEHGRTTGTGGGRVAVHLTPCERGAVAGGCAKGTEVRAADGRAL